MDIRLHQFTLRTALRERITKIQNDIDWAETNYPQSAHCPKDADPEQHASDYETGRIMLAAYRGSLRDAWAAHRAIDATVYPAVPDTLAKYRAGLRALSRAAIAAGVPAGPMSHVVMDEAGAVAVSTLGGE